MSGAMGGSSLRSVLSALLCCVCFLCCEYWAAAGERAQERERAPSRYAVHPRHSPETGPARGSFVTGLRAENGPRAGTLRPLHYSIEHWRTSSSTVGGGHRRRALLIDTWKCRRVCVSIYRGEWTSIKQDDRKVGGSRLCMTCIKSL